MKSDDERNLLDRLRGAAEPTPGEQALDRARDELGRVADPAARVKPNRIRWPWSPSARAMRAARQASVQAQLDVYLNDLDVLRAARQAVSRVTAFRAIEAAECAIFELRSQGEALRHAMLARTHSELTARFAAELEHIDALKDRLSPEMLDALRERALGELTESMKTAAKSRVEFDKQWLLKLKE